MSYGDSRIGTPWRGYYITAYGIAVKHGFKGTEEEWLASLQGVDGRSIEIRYNDVTNVLEWKFTDDDVWTQLLDLEQLQTEIVAQTLAQAQAAQQGAEAAKAAAEAAQQEAERNAGVTRADASITQTNVQLSQDAKTAAQAAQAAAGTAQQAAEAAQAAAETAETGAEESATLSKSWAVGGTGTRPGEDTNNAEYWAGQAAAAAGGGVISFNGRTGTVLPQERDYDPHMVGARPNRNIARNPDFKINQRNFASDNWTSGYGPDGWVSTGGGHLEYSGGAVKTSNQYLKQYYEPGEISAGKYTISAFCTDNIRVELGFWTGQKVNADSLNYEKGFASVTVEITDSMVDNLKNGYLYILCQNSGTVSFVKLERSTFQTLAYKDTTGNWVQIEETDYGAELARCQRYLQVYNELFVGGTTINYGPGYKLYTPLLIPAMRTKPAVTVEIGSKYGTATDDVGVDPKINSLSVNIGSSDQGKPTAAAAYINMIISAEL